MSIVVDVLLALAVGLAALCALGVAIARDPLERLHYVAQVSTVGVSLLAIAVLLDEPDHAAAAKLVLVALLVAPAGSLVAHATARACHPPGALLRDPGPLPSEKGDP